MRPARTAGSSPTRTGKVIWKRQPQREHADRPVPPAGRPSAQPVPARHRSPAPVAACAARAGLVLEKHQTPATLSACGNRPSSMWRSSQPGSTVQAAATCSSVSQLSPSGCRSGSHRLAWLMPSLAGADRRRVPAPWSHRVPAPGRIGRRQHHLDIEQQVARGAPGIPLPRTRNCRPLCAPSGMRTLTLPCGRSTATTVHQRRLPRRHRQRQMQVAALRAETRMRVEAHLQHQVTGRRAADARRPDRPGE
jgi:hypothetical protein